MAISRYKDAVEFINATEGYKKTFKERYGEKGIRQFSYGTLTYPTQDDYNNIETWRSCFSPTILRRSFKRFWFVR